MRSRPTTIRLLVALLVTQLLASSAWAMRCGNQLILKGDSQAKVLRYCGDPVTRNSRYVERAGVYRSRDGGLTVRQDWYFPFGRSEVYVEEWVYNLGPNQLMRRIRFGNGIVEEVDTLGYGYREAVTD